MGLDLSIRVQSNHGTDEFGRDTWTVTQLANLRNCYNILEQLSNRLEDGFSNCATYSFYGETFHEILKGLQEELTKLTELSKVKELDNYQRSIMETSFYGETFHEILKGLQEELTKLTELSKVKELDNYQRSIMETFSDEVSKLEDFIATNNVPDNDTESYEVHAWW